MALSFLQTTPAQKLSKIGSELSFIDSSVDLSEFSSSTIRGLNKKLAIVNEAITTRKSKGVYGSWLRDEGYVRDTLIAEALSTMIGMKRACMESEKLVPGSTYYTNVTRYGDKISGQRCIYLGERFTGWTGFTESAMIQKALLLLNHGGSDHFREIYVGMADGRIDALNEVSMEHITESSVEALTLIESYCDAQWDGPWPWELEAPEKLKMMLEHREEQTMKNISEMQNGFKRVLREFEEGTMNQIGMVTAADAMMKNVDSMIGDLAKLSGSSIEMMAQAKASGDEGMIAPLQDAMGEPLNAAITALTDLKAGLSNATSSITSGSSVAADPMGDDPMGGDDLGSPADAMGADPMADNIADLDIGGDAAERVRKDV